MAGYQIRELGNGITAIEEGAVRMFLIRGRQRALLVDTGFGGGDLRALVGQLWPGPLTVLNTHAHADHVGGDCLFPEILAHPADWRELCQCTGISKKRLCPAVEGDCIQLGGRIIEILEVPGHTPGSIALLDRSTRVLFGGDTVSDRPVFLCLPGASLKRYLESLHRLLDMSGDYDVLYASHGTVQQNAGQISALIACCNAYLRGELMGIPTEPYLNIRRIMYQHGSASFYMPG